MSSGFPPGIVPKKREREMAQERPNPMSDPPAGSAGAASSRRRLDTPRRSGRLSQKPADPPRPDQGALKQSFTELGRRSKVLFAEPRLKLPETAGLYQTAGEVMSLMRLAHRDLERLGTPHAVLVDLRAVSNALDGMRRNLDLLHEQFQQLDDLERFAAKFQPLLTELHHSRTSFSEPLWNLVREIVDETVTESTAPQAPLPKLFSPTHYLERYYKPAESYAIVKGLSTARLIASLVSKVPTWQTQRDLLIAAALLADCGFVTLCSGPHQRTAPAQLEQEEPAMFQRHPSVGAALVAGLNGIPTGLPLLIGRHHQRLDGNGFPAGLDRHGYSPSARLLAIVCRLCELQENEEATESAATVLQQEADADAWDLAITRRVLTLIAESDTGTTTNGAVSDSQARTASSTPAVRTDVPSAAPVSEQVRRDDAHAGRTTRRNRRRRSRSRRDQRTT